MINIRQFVLVALGGLIGSVLRFGISLYVSARVSTSLFPWGTFIVNVAGSFIIGAVFGYSMRSQSFEMNWRLFLTTGVCGGFTTFSAFSNESFLLLKQQHYSILLMYMAASISLSIGATAAGYWVSR
jgi:CrcB protein